MKKNFVITETEKYHEDIARVSWRRVYTTNYDNCYELAAGKAGKVMTPITLEDNLASYFRNRDICIHINGTIHLLNRNSLNKSFKLSESSYISSDAFSDSSWLYRFKKDLDICSQIVFVGYSLYDIEIKKLLVDGDSIKKKTFFITHDSISQKDYYRLFNYGEVFPIGVKAFGELLTKLQPEKHPEIKYLSSLQKEELSYGSEFGDADIRDFLLRGKVNHQHIATSLTSAKKTYAIQREQVPELLDVLRNENIIVIHGSLANGKSILARQCISFLMMEDKLVYTIKDEESDYEKDIESLASLNRRVYLLIDDFERNIDIARYFSSCLGDNGKLILTERPHRYRRAMHLLKSYGMRATCVNIDYLHEKEVKGMSQILSNTGLWGDRGGDGPEKQTRYLTDDCESQISIILLGLLKSQHVISQFRTAFSDILRYSDTQQTVHTACLIQHIYPSCCNRSFISDISESSHVYSNEFEERALESGLFEFKRGVLTTKSSIFGTFILSCLYKASYTIDQLVRIAKKLQRRNTRLQSMEEHEMFRGIMKFGTLAAVLPDDDKVKSYIQFYEKLKTEVPSVIGNPHYWLQYAMAIMSENNHLSDAERILDTAYAQARSHSDYDTTYIDNQFARLNIKKAISESDPNTGLEYFSKAHSILRKEDNDVYKFRQAGLYLIYYKERYANLSKGNKVQFEHALREILTQYENYITHEYRSGNIPPFQLNNIGEFKTVLHEISRKR